MCINLGAAAGLLCHGRMELTGNEHLQSNLEHKGTVEML